MKSALSGLLLLIAFSICAGLVSGLMLFPVAVGANQLKDTADNFYNDIDLDTYSNTMSSETTMYANDGETVLAKFFAQDRIVVPLTSIAQTMQDAIIAREDRRFYEHSGIDIIGTMRGLFKTTSGTDMQGGSTLTQQYIKNLLIDNALQDNSPINAFHAREQTLFRKIKEAKFAIEIESKMTKDQILEGYLNVAPFGTNVYGVESSSLRYFSKHASELDYNEAALIAGTTKSPVDYDPINFPDVAQNQRDTVLGLLVEEGKITQEQFDAYVAIPVPEMLHISEVPVGCQVAGDAAFFCSYVEQVILNNDMFGKTKQERRHFLYQGGLKIYTTINLDVQHAAQAAVSDMVPATDHSGIEDALVTIEAGTGNVIAMAQNRPFNPGETDQNAVDTAINYSVDKQYGGSNGFSPGSTTKIVAIVDWLRNGHSLNDGTLASKVKYPFTSASGLFACADPFSSWAPKNASGNTSSSTPLSGFNQSLNIPMIQMVGIDGMCSWADTATKLGIIDERLGDLSKADTLNPSMVIGAINVTPLNMANAYATVASGGIRCNPVAITKIIDPNGESKSVPGSKCTRTIDQNIADTAMYALKTNVTNGIARAGGISGYDIGVKTGTSEQAMHLTTVMCVPKYCSYAWMGNAQFDKELRGNIGGKYRGVWGSNDVLVYLMKPYFSQLLHLTGTPNQPFPKADPKLLVSTSAPKPPDPAPNSGASATTTPAQ